MPRAGKVCSVPGCPELATDGARCKAHVVDHFYSTPSWRTFRAHYLAMHEQCVVCGAQATEVDHIQPIRLGGERFDIHNLQALCKGCHSRKTAAERGS